jgi:murein endopeptidase
MKTPIDTMLPDEGPGFVGYNRDGNDRFATASTVAAVVRAGLLFSLVSDVPFSVGDMSRRGGGPFPGHSSHKDGVDVDVRPLRADGKNLPVVWRDAAYSRERTRRLIHVVRAAAAVHTILFNDPELRRAGLATFFAGHDNHLHIRFEPQQPAFALRRGSSGAAVECVQTRLRERGILFGIADGEFGPVTERAVVTFQRASSLPRTGVVDTATLRLLAA